jgi:hypothetical protein
MTIPCKLMGLLCNVAYIVWVSMRLDPVLDHLGNSDLPLEGLSPGLHIDNNG